MPTTPFGRIILDDRTGGVRLDHIFGHASYAQLLSDDDYRVTLGAELTQVGSRNYREMQFRKGLYLGHHVGPSGILMVENGRIFMTLPGASASGYEKVIWQFFTKFYLSYMSFKTGAAHVKCAVLFDRNGSAVLLFGRGGSGKSTLAHFLRDRGLIFAGNTHAILKGGRVWALNTWRRVRFNASEYYDPPARFIPILHGEVKRLVITSHNKDGRYRHNVLDSRRAYCYLQIFGLATTAYDLKEDLYDGLGESLFLDGVEAENQEIQRLIHQCKVTALNSDITVERIQSQVAAEILEGLCV
jgi:hypothetical protein